MGPVHHNGLYNTWSELLDLCNRTRRIGCESPKEPWPPDPGHIRQACHTLIEVVNNLPDDMLRRVLTVLVEELFSAIFRDYNFTYDPREGDVLPHPSRQSSGRGHTTRPPLLSAENIMNAVPYFAVVQSLRDAAKDAIMRRLELEAKISSGVLQMEDTDSMQGSPNRGQEEGSTAAIQEVRLREELRHAKLLAETYQSRTIELERDREEMEDEIRRRRMGARRKNLVGKGYMKRFGVFAQSYKTPKHRGLRQLAHLRELVPAIVLLGRTADSPPWLLNRLGCAARVFRRFPSLSLSCGFLRTLPVQHNLKLLKIAMTLQAQQTSPRLLVETLFIVAGPRVRGVRALLSELQAALLCHLDLLMSQQGCDNAGPPHLRHKSFTVRLPARELQLSLHPAKRGKVPARVSEQRYPPGCQPKQLALIVMESALLVQPVGNLIPNGSPPLAVVRHTMATSEPVPTGFDAPGLTWKSCCAASEPVQ